MVRIFIADDREFVRTTLRKVIRRADESWDICGEAADGREAIERAVELSPDLIILDVAMPMLDGIGAAKEIRKRLPEVPILIYTFMSFGHLEVMAKQAGAQAVVQKGDLHALIAEIRKALARPVAGAEPVSVNASAEALFHFPAGSDEATTAEEMDALQGKIDEANASDNELPVRETDLAD